MPWEHAADILDKIKVQHGTSSGTMNKDPLGSAICAALVGAQDLICLSHAAGSVPGQFAVACCQEVMSSLRDGMAAAAAHPTAVFLVVLYLMMGQASAVTCLSCRTASGLKLGDFK